MCSVLHLAVLHSASILVPIEQRSEWLQEWKSELWHICQTHPMSDPAITAFCLGAVQDALCLRRHLWQTRLPRLIAKGSAARCLLIMAAVLTLSYTVSLLSPSVRAQRQPAYHDFRQEIVLIRAVRGLDDATATIEPAQFQLWEKRPQHFFDGFAFYQPLPASEKISLARSSTNLFDLLGIKLKLTPPHTEERSSLPSAILSDDCWKQRYKSDPNIAGHIIQLGSQRATVAGIAPAGFHALPGNVDAWLMEPNADAFSSSPGFLIAHIVPAQSYKLWKNSGVFTTRLSDGSLCDFFSSALEDRIFKSHLVFLFTVILAFLALPAITSLPLGEYRFQSPRLSWSTRLGRWCFLIAKFALLLPAVFFLALDLVYVLLSLPQSLAPSIQGIAWFLLCLFGFRWALRDQRRRCPVCLSRLGKAARVGHSSKSFLAWNGTELACNGGHGLLHVPELPTSWFSTQRWLQLDASWQFLFHKPNPDSVG
jgi:hypothetical protein